MVLVLLRGGSRDGESTDLDEHVDRLFAASDAPGLIDVYEATEALASVEGNDDEAVVFDFVGQEPLTEHEGTQLHMPHTSGYA
jgi:hypothetical protein